MCGTKAPPHLPKEVPTAVYRRNFKVESAWSDRRIVLHVGAAESVHSVRVNGEFVGYGTDSRLASEYDISPFVREGMNLVSITVCRYSAQSYVEEIQNLPGVYGARMTGGGFGGCVVALCSRDADVPGWAVSAVGAARLA